MKSRLGKIFRDSKGGKLIAVEYQPTDGYYSLVKREQQNGHNQVIITSNIMLRISELLLTKYAFDITGIEFMVEGEDFEDEIRSLILALKGNKAYWASLKEKLQFLQKEDSIEIKKISFKSSQSGELLDVFVNGIFASSEATYNKASQMLICCIARCLG